MHRRIVEQLERRQFAGLGRIEHRHLAFFLDALALLDHHGGRFDARLDARGHALLFDLGRLDARLLGFEPDRDVARDAAARLDPADGVPDAGADPVDDGEPRNAEGQRDAGHPAGQQNQRGAEKIQIGGEPAADELAHHTARSLAQRAGAPSAAWRARSSRTA